jgi:hypothetical protein
MVILRIEKSRSEVTSIGKPFERCAQFEHRIREPSLHRAWETLK